MDYENLAIVYDEVMKSSHVSTYHDLLKKILGHKEIKGKSILDLGCGTGSLLRTFSGQNETRGIDSSIQMIETAREKDVRSQYSVADITDFNFDTSFDYVFCTFDTINHLSTLDEWGKVFILVSTHLKKGGLFLFDFNTLDKFQTIHNQSLVIEIDSGFFILTTIADKDNSYWKIHLFTKQPDNLYKHFSEKIKERSYPQEKIIEKLKAHFQKVEIIKTMEDGGRIFIAAKI